MSDAELEADFWKALKNDRTVMLGLSTERDPHLRPMTALIEAEAGGPVWFFTAIDTELATAVKYALPVVFLVLNDNRYGAIKYLQERMFAGRWSEADLAKFDEELKLRGRATREEWVEQAKELLAGKPPRAKVDQAEAKSGEDW